MSANVIFVFRIILSVVSRPKLATITMESVKTTHRISANTCFLEVKDARHPGYQTTSIKAIVAPTAQLSVGRP